VPDPLPKQSWLTTLGWAAYLACSWTWCIGMFLPVLLVRDFGIWGFVVFAVPNVIGAGGMGWVLKDGGAALQILRVHATAVRIFSEVTWAFQLFFFVWLLRSNEDVGWKTIGVVAGIAIIGVLLLYRLRLPWQAWLSAAVVWVASAGVFAWLAIRDDLHLPIATPTLSSNHLMWLAPVCAFGFMLCPYLDVTFLHARASQSRPQARWSFLVGFGGLFSVMILFTLLYACIFSSDGNPIVFARAKGLAAALVMLHMFQQICFTNGVHGTASRQRLKQTETGAGRGAVTALLIFLCSAWLGLGRNFTISGLTSGEIAYRIFMSFYGLVFPAYVWLCMIPLGGEQGTQAPNRIKLSLLAVAVALAGPCFWMGFIERQTWWLGPGLGIVLLARPVLSVLAKRFPHKPRTQ